MISHNPDMGTHFLEAFLDVFMPLYKSMLQEGQSIRMAVLRHLYVSPWSSALKLRAMVEQTICKRAAKSSCTYLKIVARYRRDG